MKAIQAMGKVSALDKEVSKGMVQPKLRLVDEICFPLNALGDASAICCGSVGPLGFLSPSPHASAHLDKFGLLPKSFKVQLS